MKKKVILITSGDPLASITCRSLFLAHSQGRIEIVAVINSTISFFKSAQIVIILLRKRLFAYLFYLFIENYGLRFANFLYRIGYILRLNRVSVTNIFKEAKKCNIPVIRIKNFNSESSIQHIRYYQPDILLCVRLTQILKENFINSFTTILNLHCALIQRYKGVGGIFRALANGDKELGCTVHLINSKKIDDGPIIAQEKIRFEFDQSLLFYTLKLHETANDLLLEAIDKEKPLCDPQPIETEYFSWPNRQDLKKFAQAKLDFFRLSDFSLLLSNS